MNIIRELKESIERACNVPFFYGSAEDVNRALDNADFPCALAFLIQQGAVTDVNGVLRERLTFAISFAELTQFDFEAMENEDIIERCKERAFVWLQAMRTNDKLNLISINSTTRDYIEFDAIVTGYGVNVTIEEAQGFGACDVLDVYAR